MVEGPDNHFAAEHRCCDGRASNWYFTAWRGRSRWIGMAKRSPFVNGDPIGEPGDVWFAFGPTKLQALANVERAVTDDASDDIQPPENAS
jgi:hypothetical protein